MTRARGEAMAWARDAPKSPRARRLFRRGGGVSSLELLFYVLSHGLEHRARLLARLSGLREHRWIDGEAVVGASAQRFHRGVSLEIHRFDFGEKFLLRRIDARMLLRERR